MLYKYPPLPSGHRKTSGIDFCTEAGAHELARRIKEAWADCGVIVRTKVVPANVVDKSGSRGWAVRTNLLNGGPALSREVYLGRDEEVEAQRRAGLFRVSKPKKPDLAQDHDL